VAGPIRAAWTGSAEGDLRPTAADGDAAGPLQALVSSVTTRAGHRSVERIHWMDQVHGTVVITVPDPGGHSHPPRAVSARWAGAGDAQVASGTSDALAVLTADCASVALGSTNGIFGAVHAGWRGLVGGVVEATVSAMRRQGAVGVVGALGPCVHACCYEFGADDLDRVAAAYGDGVRATTRDGRPALDLPAAISAALAAAGAGRAPGTDVCTGCGGGYFSHRVRGDRGRQVLVVWANGPPGPV